MMDGRYLPLIALGGGIMGGRIGRGLQGFAQATMQGQAMDREARQDEQRQKMLELQTGQMEAQVAAQREREQLLGRITSGMDPQQANFVRALGPEALQAEYNRLYGPKEAPKLETLYEGGTQRQGYFGPDGNFVTVSEAPRWQPQQQTPKDSFRALTPEELKQYGFAPGSVVEVNTRTNDLHVVQTPPSAGSEPIVSIMGEDGKAVYVPQSQAIGKQPAAKREDDPSFDRTTTLRKEFENLPEVKSYKEVIPVVNSARASAKQDTRASDLDLVYAVGKVLDPNSVVREGEQIMITNSQSPANQLAGYINSLSGGAKFTPELRADLLRLLDNRALEWQNMYNQRAAQYRRLGNQNNLDSSQIVEQLPPIIGSNPVPPGGVPNFNTPAPGSAASTERRASWGLQ